MLHGLLIGGLSPIRTRDWTAAARGCGIHCDRDVILRTWLVHLGSAPLIRYGRGEGHRAHLSPRKGTAARGRASTRLLDAISPPAQRSTRRRGENTRFHPKSAVHSAEIDANTARRQISRGSSSAPTESWKADRPPGVPQDGSYNLG